LKTALRNGKRKQKQREDPLTFTTELESLNEQRHRRKKMQEQPKDAKNKVVEEIIGTRQTGG